MTDCEVVPSPGHRHERPAEGAEIARLLGVSSVRPGAGPMKPAGTSKTFTSSVSPTA